MSAPRVKLNVTQEIIDEAVQANSSHCVYAEAIKAAVPGAKRIAVDIQTMRFTLGDERLIYLTPRTAQEDIVNFDQGEKPPPRSLELRNGHVIPKGSGPGKDRQRKATLVAGEHKGSRGDSPPVPFGGKSPPRAALGQRREFGLRAARR